MSVRFKITVTILFTAFIGMQSFAAEFLAPKINESAYAHLVEVNA